MQDKLYITLIQNGDDQAFREVYTKYHNKRDNMNDVTLLNFSEVVIKITSKLPKQK